MSEVTLFVRKASGLVRAWSVFDAFIYATFSINLITLGLYIFSFTYYFQGNLATAVVIGGIFTIFEVIVYASLISAMPRAGGDYVWQSRILGRTLGFILAVTGWWFILWLWVPLYGQMLVYEFYTPVLGILGLKDAALWFTNTSTGLLVGMLSVCLFAFVYIAIGMKNYARVQKFCFFGGLVGLVLVFLLLLLGNNQTFQANLNALAPQLFGAQSGTDLYQATLKAGEAAGTTTPPLGNLAFIGSFALIPYIVFFNLWPNWGSTLYGEVRGATDYKRNFWGMAWAVILTAVAALLFFALIAKTVGWDFYNRANGAFWGPIYNPSLQAAPLPFWPYPALFATFMVQSRAIQLLVILLMSLWWFGWSGTVFLSSTRVIFAAAFDRMLPEWVAKVEPRTRTPIIALLLMVIPGAIVSFLYAFNVFKFQTIVLDATLVIAVTFFGTTIAGIILPWKQREVYQGSPIAKFHVPGWLGWLTMIVFAAGSIFLMYRSISYGVQVWGSLPGAGANTITYIIVAVMWAITIANVILLAWLTYYVATKMTGSDRMPTITFAGLIFLWFLDWLLIEWLWDPNRYYGIGWYNVSSMIYMFLNYLLAAAIYYGFNAYRRRQGIDVDKVYKEIPREKALPDNRTGHYLSLIP